MTPAPATAAPTSMPDVAPRRPAARTAHRMLLCGVVAGPLYVAVWLTQALVRDGFDLTRHPASVLSNGPGGWVQTANFLLAGALTLVAAAGVRKALGSRLVGGLLAGYGAGLVGGGVFPADPVDGFPVGTPLDGAVSATGLLHMVSGGVGLVCLAAGCLVVARGSLRTGAPGWAAFSTLTAVLYVVALVGISSGEPTTPVVLGFTAAVLLGWAWLSALCVRLRAQTGSRRPAAGAPA